MQKQVDGEKKGSDRAAKGTGDVCRQRKRDFSRLFYEHMTWSNIIRVTTENGMLKKGQIAENRRPNVGYIYKSRGLGSIEGKMLKPIVIDTPAELVTIYWDGSIGREPKLLQVENIILEEALRLVVEMTIKRGLSGSHVNPELEKPIRRLADCFARNIEPDSFAFFAASSDPIFTKEELREDVVGGAIRELAKTDIVSACFIAAGTFGTSESMPGISRIIVGNCKKTPSKKVYGVETGIYLRYHEGNGMGGWGRSSYYELGIFRAPVIDIAGLNELASFGTDYRIRVLEKICLDARVDNYPQQMRKVIKKIYSEEQSWWKRAVEWVTHSQG